MQGDLHIEKNHDTGKISVRREGASMAGATLFYASEPNGKPTCMGKIVDGAILHLVAEAEPEPKDRAE